MSAIDSDKLKMFSFLLFSKLEGAVTSGMVHLGDQLGLYTALASAAQPLTTAQLAHATELNERWVREWAYNQASARLISTTNTPSESPSIDDDQFFLVARASCRTRRPEQSSIRYGDVPSLATNHGSTQQDARKFSHGHWLRL